MPRPALKKCRASPDRAQLRRARPRKSASPCHASPVPASPRLKKVPCHTVPCRAMPRHEKVPYTAIPRRAEPHRAVKKCLAEPRLAQPCRATPCHVIRASNPRAVLADGAFSIPRSICQSSFPAGFSVVSAGSCGPARGSNEISKVVYSPPGTGADVGFAFTPRSSSTDTPKIPESFISVASSRGSFTPDSHLLTVAHDVFNKPASSLCLIPLLVRICLSITCVSPPLSNRCEVIVIACCVIGNRTFSLSLLFT